MAAANTDKFRKKESNFSTTLSSSITDADTTIPLSSASGLPTDTAITLTIDRVDSNGSSTPSSVERVTGVISGNNLTNALRGEDGTTAQAHDSGAVVEDIWDGETWNDALDGILVEHAQDGTHSAVTVSSTLDVTGITSIADHLDMVDGKSIRDGNNNEVISVSQTASAVNEITVKNQATGSPPEIQATGDDTNIDLHIVPKGTGKVVVLGSGGEEIASFETVASAVNYIETLASATGNDVQIKALGDDTNIGIDLVPKGTGVVDAQVGLKIASSTVTADDILDEDDLSSDSATALATQQSIKAYVDNNSSGGGNLGSSTELTISSGEITVTGNFHTVDTEGDAGTDDLDTINGGSTGDLLVLRSTLSSRDVVCKDSTGNLRLAGDFTLTDVTDTIMLILDGTTWRELSRSDNA